MLKFLDFHLMRNEDFVDEDPQDPQNVACINGTCYYPIAGTAAPRNVNDFAQFFDEDATGESFVLSESLITQAKDFLSQYPLDERTIEAVTEILGNISYAKGQETWGSMVDEANDQYQNMMRYEAPT